jgi:hypothetical protein
VRGSHFLALTGLGAPAQSNALGTETRTIRGTLNGCGCCGIVIAELKTACRLGGPICISDVRSTLSIARRGLNGDLPLGRLLAIPTSDCKLADGIPVFVKQFVTLHFQRGGLAVR